MIEKYIGLHRINGKLERDDNIEYTEDEVVKLPPNKYEIIMDLAGYERQIEWDSHAEEREQARNAEAQQREEYAKWMNEFKRRIAKGGKCPICTMLQPAPRRSEDNEYMPYYLFRDEYTFDQDDEEGTHLDFRKDEDGKFFIIAGEEYSTLPYYPKFCPECGRKL